MRGLLPLLLLSCTGSPGPTPVADTASAHPWAHLEPLDAPRLARRMSLDLRGVLPTAEELDAVHADPAALEDLRDAWLDDPLLEERLVHLLAERWHTRVDRFDIEPYDFGYTDEQTWVFHRTIGEEPLRLMARIVVEDRSWTEVVTADHTVADEVLAELFPIERDPGAEGWVEARYTDGRPAAGVLATNGLWWRYPTTIFNLNRSRAAAISRLLVCEDILARPVTFADATALLGDEGTAAAITSEQSCIGCHSTLEPVAAVLFGFQPDEVFNVVEASTYHPERELAGPEALGVQMAWYGQPVDDLAHLGRTIAADPRFAECAVQTFAEGLWRRPVAVGEKAEVEALRDVLVEEEGRIKPLLAAITDTAAYRAGGAEYDEEAVVARLLPPDVLTTAIEDATGFAWTADDVPVLDQDTDGVRILAGGVDGVQVQGPPALPGLTSALTVRELALGAADHVVETELVDGAEGSGLLGDLSLDDRPGDAAFDDTLAAIVWRLHAEHLDDAARTELEELWEAVEADTDAAEAWKAVLMVLLRDPAMVTA